MAELNTSESHGKKKGGGVRAKKMSTRIDMTPMVDLAFLLVTFFMLTTTFSKPTAMNLVMPDDDKTIKEDDKNKVKASEALTIILGKDDHVFYYEGLPSEDATLSMQSTGYGADKIRKVLRDKRSAVLATQPADKQDGPVVLIKPLQESRYQNLVDILDDMKICDIQRYAIVGATPEEIAMLPK